MRFEVLIPDPPGEPVPLPDPLAAIYGPTSLPADLVYANFVQTIDGVVAFEPEAAPSAGAAISGRNPGDRLVMALLRACAGAILVGAATMAPETRHLWTPEALVPEHAEAFAELRRRLGLAPVPDLYVFSNSGRVDAGAAAIRAGATVVTGTVGARRAIAATDKLLVAGDATVDVARAVARIRAAGHRRLLTEGGPRLLAALLAQGLVDDLFLTIAPRIAGRSGPGRPGLVEGLSLPPDNLLPASLRSLRASEGFLFARYQLSK